MSEIATEIQSLVSQAQNLFENLVQDIKGESAVLEDIRDRINIEREGLATIVTAKNVAQADFDQQKASIHEEMVPLKNEKTHLETEVADLVTKKADLKLENARLAESNKKFSEYEAKAWKVLEAKETELVSRDEALLQKESLSPRVKTLLPPVE